MNRGHLHTEQRLASAAAIDALTVEQTLRLINTQDLEVPRVVRDAIPATTKFIEATLPRLQAGGKLYYVGAGTSGRLGVLDAAEIPPTFQADPSPIIGLIAGGDKALKQSAEGKEDDDEAAAFRLKMLKLGVNDTVLGIAAGGTTPYVWGALRYAKEAGAATGLISCVPLKQLAPPRPRAAVVRGNDKVELPPPPKLPATIDYPIELPVGPEVITGSTRMKAGTATKLTLNMISTGLMVQLGKAWGNLMVDLRATNDKLIDRALRILTHQCRIDRDEAMELLEQANMQVKVALVMHRRKLDAQDAEALIEEHDGKLRPILGPPRA